MTPTLAPAPAAAVAAPATRTPTSHAARGAGIVVIGRNEGQRLLACLGDLQRQPRPVLYVDSGSSDGSPEGARALGVAVLELDPSRPFSAARARNEGAAALWQQHPELDFVQFLDGDCMLAPGWLDEAEEALRSDAACALAVGHLQERNPQGSVYNLLCALEWRSPSGPVSDADLLGGILMVRRSVFETLRGYNASLIAGEDPEFGVRVSLAGHRMHKLDATMAVHDADIHRFSQWWKRAIRGGHAIGQRAELHARDASRDGAHQRTSTLAWGLALPAAILLALPATNGASLALTVGYLPLALRIARYRRNRGDTPREARLYAAFTVLGKFANAVGLVLFYVNRMRGRVRIIEYK